MGQGYQIRLTMVHRSTSSNFHFLALPLAAFGSAPKSWPLVAGVCGREWSGRSSSSFERYWLVCLLYAYKHQSFRKGVEPSVTEVGQRHVQLLLYALRLPLDQNHSLGPLPRARPCQLDEAPSS